MLEHALAAYAAKLSVLPPREDGSKQPLGRWTQYQQARADEDQVRRWYANGRAGLGAVTGRVSGNLECFEFDDARTYADLKALAVASGLGDPLARIEAGYLEQSPSGGIHWLYRCPEIAGNTKLANRPEGLDERGQTKVKTLIETRGEGGFVVLAPSHGSVHPTGKPYVLLAGSFATIAAISPGERRALFDLARVFDAQPVVKAAKTATRQRQCTTGDGERPGDRFNAETDWIGLLEPRGWVQVYERGGVNYWRRPGKDHGISATTGFGGDWLYVFSSSTKFETGRCYDRFGAFAVLEHGGDFAEATRAAAVLFGNGSNRSTVTGELNYAPQNRPEQPEQLDEFGEFGQPAQSAAKFGELGQLAQSRPVIQLAAGQLPRLLRDAENALIRTGEVFHKAGLLVRVARMGRREDHGVSYADNALTVLPVTAGWMTVALGRAASWRRCTGKDGDAWQWVPADPPARIARMLLEMAGEWRLPYLSNLIECPTLRRDGSVLEREGYDPETGLYFDAGGVEFAPIPAHPTRAQAEAALAELADVVRDFPFENDHDRSVFLSGALTVPVRHMLRDSPLHCFSASRPRAGKSFQADLCALIATGREAPAMNAADDASEEEKRIVSILLSGVPLALIDNIDEPLKSARLCSAITQATYSGRLLGVNRMVNLPTRLVWFASGNNLRLHDDLNPRALLGYLVPDTDRPEERQFDRDLKTWVVEQRPRLASAVIIILRAYLCAGSPGQGLRGFGAAPDWSALVRSALVWLGRADPVLTQERLRANDPVSTNLARLLQAWREAFGEQTMTTAEIVKAAHNKPDLVDVLLEVASKDGEKINTRSLGKYLGAHINRIEGGLKLTVIGLSHQSMLWRVQCVSNRSPVNSPNPPNSRQPPPTEPTTGELGEFREFPACRFETCSTCARYIASPCSDGGVCERHESAVENPAVRHCGDWAALETGVTP